MITIKEAEEILKKEYHIDNFTYVVQDILLPDFVPSKHEVQFNNNIFNRVKLLGESKKCELNVYEVILNEGTQNRRVAITQEMFRILRGHGINNALVAFANADMKNYRLSLLTSKYEFDGDKVVKVLSNPRRYSYALGFGTKTKTAYQFLIAKGKVNSLDELIDRFSVEVVNKQFYNEIALSFTKLIGGRRDGKDFERELSLYGVTSSNKYAEFAVRLIGRIIFCWFLREKKSENEIPLIPDEILSLVGISNSNNYYHDVLEPLFFELLNTNQRRRRGKFATEKIYNQIPYLNGGLFSPHNDDQYKYSLTTQTGQYGQVTIPNDWFADFYNILGEYNFTVDENTAYDIELSIDPEMLGRIFENLLAEINPETGENAKKSTGSFYTPRDIVDYMVDNSLLEYLKTKTAIDELKLKALISYSKDDDYLTVFDNQEKKEIINALYTITVLDPACGSGAFPIGILQKIVYISQEIDPDAKLWLQKSIPSADILLRREIEEKITVGDLNYIRKLNIIQHSIFGVDIQPIAVEIARLRCFLSLVIEETVHDDMPNRGIKSLPNLDFKFIIANTLRALPHDSDINDDVHVNQMSLFENQDHIAQLKEVREEYFGANNIETKTELKFAFSEIQKAMFQEAYSNNKIASARYQALFQWEPFGNNSTNWFDADWMFGIKDGFDIVIGNPPYVSTKNVAVEDKKLYEKQFGFSDDTYNLFTFKGMSLLKNDGSLNYIIPKTFWTTQTKRNMRDLLLENTLSYIYDSANPFDAVMVDTCIIQVIKRNYSEQHQIKFVDGDDFYFIDQSIYLNTQNSIIFKPTEINMRINRLYGEKVKKLYDTWWDCIKTSKDIEKNATKLRNYREQLKPGDIALLGCLTEGGQGLATANNGKYIAVRKSTKWAKNILESRPKKLAEAMKNKKIPLTRLLPYNSIEEFFISATEKEIEKLFDALKDEYGRDIFGQGYIFRLIDDCELADVNNLTDDEKENGIDSSKNYYVPYDKGDKDGNRWYLETPFAIAWSKENVRFLKTNSGKKGAGMPVVRNPQFNFKEGFCWSDINTTYLKCRIKGRSINDVKSMSLYGLCENIPEYYFVALMNSSFISFYVDTFVNNTQTFQINDARQLPIVIPNDDELRAIKDLVDYAVSIKKDYFAKLINNHETESKLDEIQHCLDNLVLNIYKI